MSRRHQRACPTALKKAYGTEDLAREAYAYETRNREPFAPFAYPCVCGRWHRTSKKTEGSVYLGA